MIYADANVIIRYYTQDHNELSSRAKSLLESKKVFVTESVLVELDFTFRSSYQISRAGRIKIFANLFGELDCRRDPYIDEAFELYKSYSKLSFADCILMIRSQSDELATFDTEIVRIRAIMHKKPL